MALTKAQLVDLNANELIIDLDADTSITADTDDQIDIKIAGADDFQFTAKPSLPCRLDSFIFIATMHRMVVSFEIV